MPKISAPVAAFLVIGFMAIGGAAYFAAGTPFRHVEGKAVEALHAITNDCPTAEDVRSWASSSAARPSDVTMRIAPNRVLTEPDAPPVREIDMNDRIRVFTINAIVEAAKDGCPTAHTKAAVHAQIRSQIQGEQMAIRWVLVDPTP